MSNNNYAQWLPYYATVIVNIQPSVLNTQQKEHLNSSSDDVPQRALEGESTGQLEKGIREGTRESIRETLCKKSTKEKRYTNWDRATDYCYTTPHLYGKDAIFCEKIPFSATDCPLRYVKKFPLTFLENLVRDGPGGGVLNPSLSNILIIFVLV